MAGQPAPAGPARVEAGRRLRAPDQMDAAFEAVRNRWDTEEIVALAFLNTSNPASLVDALYTRSVIIPAGIPGRQTHILVARGDALYHRVEDVESTTMCLAVANALASGLNLLEPDDANTRVRQAVREILRREVFRRGLINVTPEVWQGWMRSAEGAHAAGILNPIPWLPQEREELRQFEWPDRPVDNGQIRMLLEQLITAATPFLRDLGVITLFAYAFLGFAKKGIISQRKLDAVINQIESETGKRLDLSVGIIKDMWQKVGAHIPYRSIPPMFRTWEAEMGESCLRMRIILEQAAWTGLTHYTTILKMFTDHPGFPWAKVAALLPRDWANFLAALSAVGNDAYYGFQQNLGDAAATKLASLGYVAKEMMVKVGGRDGRAIIQYKGWTSNPLRKTALDAIIAGWDPTGNAANLVPDLAAVPELCNRLRRVHEQGQAGQGVEDK